MEVELAGQLGRLSERQRCCSWRLEGWLVLEQQRQLGQPMELVRRLGQRKRAGQVLVGQLVLRLGEVLGRQQQLVLGQRRQLERLWRERETQRKICVNGPGHCLRRVRSCASIVWHLPTTAALLIKVAAGSFGSTPGSLVWIEALKPAASAT